MTEKTKVLICTLTTVERSGWLNPPLVMDLIVMLMDPRFQMTYRQIHDARPWSYARNAAIAAAREMGVDYCLMLDNDVFRLRGNPLDLIAAGKDVVGLSYGIGAPATGNSPGAYALYPFNDHGALDGQFREEKAVAGGALLIRNRVWQKIKGPWFRWPEPENELLAPDGKSGGEDLYFCNLVREHGFKVWTHLSVLAGHFKTADTTAMVCGLNQVHGTR